jgi:hypothetical protein
LADSDLLFVNGFLCFPELGETIESFDCLVLKLHHFIQDQLRTFLLSV